MKKTNIEIIKNLKLKTYTAKSFIKHWDYDFGTSKRQGVRERKIIVVYELWRGLLICRLFYLEEGYECKKIYHEIREVTRYVAGEKLKIIQGISNDLAGINVHLYPMYSFQNRWIETKYKSFIPVDFMYYNTRTFKYIEHNDYLPLLKKSIHKYSAAELIYNPKDHYPNTLFEYLYKYNKHQELEMILKMGMKHLIKDMRYFRWSKKKIYDVLGVDKEDIRILQAGTSILDYRKNKEILKQLNQEEIKKFNEIIHSYRYTHIKDIINKKTMAYVTRIEDIDIYDDYLYFANKIGLDLTRNKYLYPNDIEKAHDNAEKKYYMMQSKIHKDDFKKAVNKFKKHVFENGPYVIVPVQSEEQLITESKVLRHCVRTYAKQVANGSTEILFIRKVEDRDTPFVTVEVRDKRLIQVRGKNNGSPSEDVKEFLNIWCAKNKIESLYN